MHALFHDVNIVYTFGGSEALAEIARLLDRYIP